MSTISHTVLSPQQADALVILMQKLLTAAGGGLGAGGSERINGAGDTVTDRTIFCFVPVQDTVIGAAVGNAGGLVGATNPAGIPVYGIWTQLTQASGEARYYYLP